MESFGVRLNITHYAHDNDGATRNLMTEFYPNAQE